MPLIPQAAPGGIPPELLAALAGGGGPGGPQQGPPPSPPQGQGGGQPDPLDALQQVIQDLHTLIAVLPDPQATQVASQCLAQLTRVQATLMQAGQSATDSQQAVLQKLGG